MLKGAGCLKRGVPILWEEVVIPSEEKIIFDYNLILGSVDIIEPDVVPENEAKKNTLLSSVL